MPKAGSKSAQPPTCGAPMSIRFDHAQQDLRPLPRRRRPALRHRRHLHPRQHPSGRRPGEGRNHRVPQAQRALRSHRRLAGARAGLPRPGHLSGRRARRPDFVSTCSHAGGVGARAQTAFRFRVVSNSSVATFIKELVLEPRDRQPPRSPSRRATICSSTSPPTTRSASATSTFPSPIAAVWKNQHVFDLVARNPQPGRRNNYSLASNPRTERQLRFNVRIATPPPGQDCAPGVGSSYVFSLKPGDTVTAIGPFGDFHIKPTQHEMVYIGGGAGMAPLRAHLSHLLETGAQRAQDQLLVRRALAAGDFLRGLFPRARSAAIRTSPSISRSPRRCPRTTGPGTRASSTKWCWRSICASTRIREPRSTTCAGRRMMIKACTRMLASIGVPEQQIAYDEF